VVLTTGAIKSTKLLIILKNDVIHRHHKQTNTQQAGRFPVATETCEEMVLGKKEIKGFAPSDFHSVL